MFSLGIAAFQEGRSIAAALEALLRSAERTGVPYEVIVVISGSTDDSVAEAERTLGDRHSAQMIIEPERRGKVAALNLIAARAQGDFILFCDADVLASADAVEIFATEFAADPALAVAYARPCIMSGESRWFTLLAKCNASAADAFRSLSDGSGAWFVCGHLYAVRRAMWQAIPAQVVSDDPFVGLTQFRGGRTVRYLRDARVYINAPQTLRDYLSQKLRNRGGRLQLRVHGAPRFVAYHAARRLGLRGLKYLPLVALDTVLTAAALLASSQGKRASPLWDPIATSKLRRP
jgi:poly-beta-1,6-N-acetyl-D-glucosamine synthase